MQKKLFIIGAGSSKDINKDMPLGADIIKEIKFLKFRIYYELVALVTVSCFYKKFLSKNIMNCIQTPAFVISKFIRETNEIQINALGEYNIKIIEEFILKILESDDKFRSEDQNSDLKNKEILEEVLNFFGLDQYDPTDQFQNTIFYKLTSFQPNSFFDQRQAKDNELLNFRSCLEEILDFIFPNEVVKKSNEEYDGWLESREWFRTELKNYVINGIIISVLLGNFDENLYSIDHIINFLSSASHYNNTYAKKYNFPEVKDLENFTIEFITSYVGEKYTHLTNKENWINCLKKMVFLNKEDEIDKLAENIELINFNYDFYVEEFLGYLFSGSNSEPRKKALDILIKKSRESHIYGAMKSAGGDSFINYLLREIKWFSNCLSQEKRRISFGSGSEDSQIITTTSTLNEIQDKIRKRKESRWINLIRTDFTAEEIESYFSKIGNSDITYILGFGFDNWNLRNIGLLDGDEDFSLTNGARLLSGKTIYITNYGDEVKTRLMIEKLFQVRLYKESESVEFLESEKGKKEIKYSFWRSGTGQQNDVFVSTKPVYRALTEDFIF